LLEMRLERRLTQVELARRANVRQATVAAIEAGKTRGIDFETLARLGRALQVDPATLITTDPPRFSTMHDKYTEHNMAVHDWLERQDLIVRNERLDFERDALIWDVGTPESNSSRPLRISLRVLEDVSAADLGARLDLCGAGEGRLKGAAVIVKQRQNRNLVATEFTP
jgi:transcriptional regulator with XRE-family HTH domain